MAKVSIDGGTPVALASGQNEPGRLTVDSSSVYWAEPSAGTVMKLTPK